jgi:hypothetical protein
MRKPPVQVSEDPRIRAALAVLGQPVLGDYVITRPLVLTKPDGRVKEGGWQSREGLPEGAVVQIRKHYLDRFRDAEIDYAYEIRLFNGHTRSDVLKVCHYKIGTTEKSAVFGCPEIRDDVPDVEWALTLLTSLAPRPGAAGLLSRINPTTDAYSSIWHDVFLRLIEEGTLTEAQLRAAVTREEAHRAAEDDKEEAALAARAAERAAAKANA